MRHCNIGYSDSVETAIRDALKRHGEVVSTSEDDFIALRLGTWTLRTYPALKNMKWMHNYALKRDGEEPECGQCCYCSDITPATVARTAANLPYIEPEGAHILEDNVARGVLEMLAAESELAAAAHRMMTTKRTRWYA